jgi:type IV pilus assembly protein PilC
MSKEFHYKAIDTDGNVQSGLKIAEDEISLSKDLRAEGLNLINAELSSKFSFSSIKSKLENFGTVSTHDKIIIYRNISAMLNAGLSLSRALSVMTKQSKNPKLKQILTDINDNVKKGSSFSDALGNYPNIFTPLMISMVRAGEESGNLVNALDITAEQMEKSYQLKKKIKGAMVYPGVIISAMLIVAFFMMIYIVPTLTSTFSELNVELPASTQFIISFSDLLQNNLLLFFAGLITIAVLFIGFIKTKVGKRTLDWGFLHIPLVAPLVKEINAARTTRTLASLLSSGVSFVRSLEIVKEVIQNSYYKEVITKAEKNIQLGLPISKVFEEADHLYPIFVGEMMAVGEETGDLGNMLLKVALFYEAEVDEQTKNMSTIIEPFLMIVVGSAVGFFAISMISPMYSLVESI